MIIGKKIKIDGTKYYIKDIKLIKPLYDPYTITKPLSTEDKTHFIVISQEKLIGWGMSYIIKATEIEIKVYKKEHSRILGKVLRYHKFDKIQKEDNTL